MNIFVQKCLSLTGLQGFWQWLWYQVRPVAYKECVHIINDPSTLRVAVLLPLFQICIFGFAINLDVTNIPTVVYNQDGHQASRELLQQLENTTTFAIHESALNKRDVIDAIRRGSSKIGIVIPRDYSAKKAMGRPTNFQVLIDGSQSTVATQALSATTQLGTLISISETDKKRVSTLPSKPLVEAEPYVLYNPSLKTSFFTIPGLLGVVLLNVTLFLTTFSLVKEREQGTMDQLMVTPLKASGLLVGKILPYVGLGFFDFNLVVVAMILLFHIPIAGNLLFLELCALLFLFSVLGIGLLVSSRSTTQMGAAQTAGLVVLPSILLSGFVFSIEAMPPLVQGISYMLPMTYFIICLRGIVLRGAGIMDLWHPLLMLAVLGLLIMGYSVLSFRRRAN